jgi:hypothetical protein
MASHIKKLVALAAASVFVAGCGGGGGDSDSPPVAATSAEGLYSGTTT